MRNWTKSTQLYVKYRAYFTTHPYSYLKMLPGQDWEKISFSEFETEMKQEEKYEERSSVDVINFKIPINNYNLK